VTYLLYGLWILSLILIAGELDRLISQRIVRRFNLNVPEVGRWIPLITSLVLPGVGQFLNGQPIKALFVLTWPFLAAFKAPVPPPWQMVMTKTYELLLPWYLLTVLDALIVALILNRRRTERLAEVRRYEQDRSDKVVKFLSRRNDPNP
jgi:membrane protein implicated in regulation of membrane protease activity